nr:hypothetical protein CFP56_37323 [Quercus suber]
MRATSWKSPGLSSSYDSMREGHKLLSASLYLASPSPLPGGHQWIFAAIHPKSAHSWQTLRPPPKLELVKMGGNHEFRPRRSGINVTSTVCSEYRSASGKTTSTRTMRGYLCDNALLRSCSAKD